MECPPAPRKRRLDSDDDAFGKVALIFESTGKVRRTLLLPRVLDDESAPEEPASPLKGEPSQARAVGKSPARPQTLRFASGDAASACFVCLSQAPDNLTQSKYALEFGEVFGRLVAQPDEQRKRNDERQHCNASE